MDPERQACRETRVQCFRGEKEGGHSRIRQGTLVNYHFSVRLFTYMVRAGGMRVCMWQFWSGSILNWSYQHV